MATETPFEFVFEEQTYRQHAMINSGPDVTSKGQGLQTRGPLIGDDVLRLIEIVDKTAFGTAISLFGIVTNIINIVIFVRHKFADPANVSLFGLAMADLGGLACLLWSNLGSHPLIIQFVDLPYQPGELMIVTAGLYRVCFARVSCWITIFITIQRCLCVSLPLRASAVLTSKMTAVIIVAIFVAVFFLIMVTMCFTGALKISPKFYPKMNRTLIGIVFTDDWWRSMYLISNSLISFVQIASFVTIIISVGVLVAGLRRINTWRETAVSSNAGKLITKRDRSLVKQVISLSTILIACYCPGTFATVLSYALPEYRTFGKEENIYFFTWTIAIFLEGTHSSVSIFVYYKMSSRYRRTFDEVFSVCTGRKAVK